MSKNQSNGRSAPKTVRKKEQAISADIDPFSKLLDLEPGKENIQDQTPKTKAGRRK